MAASDPLREDPMLRSLKDLEQYTVSATDGEIGRVANFLLDDRHWVVRYLVVEGGGLLGDRRVLVSPVSFREAEWSNRRFHLALTVTEVRESPDAESDKPVSRQREASHSRYGGHPYEGWFAGSGAEQPTHAQRTAEVLRSHKSDDAVDDIHLQSAGELRGYHIRGSDGTIGRVDDFIVDDETWSMRYLVVDTANWWFGKKVLVAPQWANAVSWTERAVSVAMSRQGIKDSPEWDPHAAINREYEARLYDYYGRPVYWTRSERKDEQGVKSSRTPTK